MSEFKVSSLEITISSNNVCCSLATEAFLIAAIFCSANNSRILFLATVKSYTVNSFSLAVLKNTYFFLYFFAAGLFKE